MKREAIAEGGADRQTMNPEEAAAGGCLLRANVLVLTSSITTILLWPASGRLALTDVSSWIAVGRKTEEGFFIFKEAELGIRPESGGRSRHAPFYFPSWPTSDTDVMILTDTPLCPFDCECCKCDIRSRRRELIVDTLRFPSVSDYVGF